MHILVKKTNFLSFLHHKLISVFDFPFSLNLHVAYTFKFNSYISGVISLIGNEILVKVGLLKHKSLKQLGDDHQEGTVQTATRRALGSDGNLPPGALRGRHWCSHCPAVAPSGGTAVITLHGGNASV